MFGSAETTTGIHNHNTRGSLELVKQETCLFILIKKTKTTSAAIFANYACPLCCDGMC